MESSVLAVLIFRLTYQVVPLVVSLFLFHGVVPPGDPAGRRRRRARLTPQDPVGMRRG